MKTLPNEKVFIYKTYKKNKIQSFTFSFEYKINNNPTVIVSHILLNIMLFTHIKLIRTK